jgi:hypothetical protein
LGERLNRTQEVRGSNPLGSTKLMPPLHHGGRLPPMDEDDDPQPDAFSTLYDPLRGLRERWLSRLSWWQRALLFVAIVTVVVMIALLKTIRINV